MKAAITYPFFEDIIPLFGLEDFRWYNCDVHKGEIPPASGGQHEKVLARIMAFDDMIYYSTNSTAQKEFKEVNMREFSPAPWHSIRQFDI